MLLRKLTARGKSQVNYRNKKLDLFKKLVRNIRTNSEKRMTKGSTKDRSVLNYLTLSFLHQSDILLFISSISFKASVIANSLIGFLGEIISLMAFRAFLGLFPPTVTKNAIFLLQNHFSIRMFLLLEEFFQPKLANR